MKPKINIYMVVELIVFLSAKSLAWDTSEKDNCAEIYFEPEFQGRSLHLRNSEQIPDLAYVLSKFYRKGVESNASMSLKMHRGCNLLTADRAFMKGKQYRFEADLQSFEMGEYNMKSLFCNCPQICKCEDAVLRNRECARAYLEQSCENCDAYFTSLIPGEGIRQFPPKWKDIVSSIIVRRGCELSIRGEVSSQNVIYSNLQETTQLNTTRKNLVQPRKGTITNYECHCNASFVVKKSQRSQNPNYPSLLSIPKTKPELLSLLSQDGMKNHPGVMSALQSLKIKRSSHNAYILLIGLTGSGKSTAINMLFDHPNITKVGGVQSTTTDIHEFRIRLKVDELGISNAELRVIDTPGTSGTRGITQDSKFLASLEEYLDNHEDLKDKVPNVVLIFSKFDDNRYSGDGSSFVKMLRTIDLFKDRIIDRKFTNVIFVLSHFMSETSSIRENPDERINAIRKVVEEFSTLPKPINIVVAENKPEEFHIPSLNGFYILPNGDLYPQNLFSQMQSTLVTGGDPVGEAIIRVGFKNSDYFRIIGKTFKLVDETNPKVTKYMGALSSFDTPMGSTAVSATLSESYSKLGEGLKRGYPGILSHLQRSLFQQSIHEPRQLPKSTEGILKFFEDVPINEASLFLLRDAFNLTIPEFRGKLLVGCGYDLINDKVLPSPLFSTDKVAPSEAQFQFPQGLNVEMLNRMENLFYVFISKAAYVKARLNNLGLDETSFPPETVAITPMGLKDGYNIVESGEAQSGQLTESGDLSAVFEYHSFQLSLSNTMEISPEFTSILGSLEPLNRSDFDSFTQWDNFFKRYGTHVVASAYGGGRLKMKVHLPVNSQTNLTKTEQYSLLTLSMSQLVQTLADSFIGKKSPPLQLPQGVTHQLNFEGSDPNLASILQLDSWKESIQYHPIMLESHLELLPISDVARLSTTPSSAELIESAASTFFNASLIYIPVARANSGTGISREHTLSGKEAGVGSFEMVTQFAEIFNAMATESSKMQDKLLAVMQDKGREFERQEKVLADQAKLEQGRWEQLQKTEERKISVQEQLLHDESLRQLEVMRVQKLQFQMQIESDRAIAETNARAQQQAGLWEFIARDSERRFHAQLEKKSVWDRISNIGGNALKAISMTLPFLAMG